MGFVFNKTSIKDLLIIESHVFTDERGLYRKYFEKNVFMDNGIEVSFTESSDIVSRKGVLRGVHYQEKYSQAKLVHVLTGSIFDVAIDLRKNSKTFGSYHVEVLTGNDNKVIFVPEGFAHGFIALEDNTVYSHQCSGKYHPESVGGIIWNDTELSIPWPLDEYGIVNVITTDKDSNWPTFNEYCKLKGLKTK